MNKLVSVGLLVLGLCLFVSAQRGYSNQRSHRGMSRRISLAHGDYDCSCSYYCPSFGVNAGPCYPDNDDYFRWGRQQTASYCCVPSYMDYDKPDQPDRPNYMNFY